MMQKNVFKTLVLSAFIFTMMAGIGVFVHDAKAGTKTTFPTSFDLRTYDHVSPVRDSSKAGTGNWQTSWAFAVMASLESNYLKAGGTGEPDYSEMFLTYYCYINQDETLLGFGKGDKTYPGALQTSGDEMKATALLSRWTGIVNETDAPYGQKPSGNEPAVRRLQDVYYLDGSGKINSESVKQALTDHGAVVASVWSGGLSNADYLSSNNSYFVPSSKVAGSGKHYLTIVGWDDKYSRGKFAITPDSDGAWIAKISSGTDFGDVGYIYISYKDSTLSGGSAFVSVPADKYEFIYQHDVLGWISTIAPEGMEDHTAWFANVFEAKSTESLKAVSFYTVSANCTYDIAVYTGVTGDPNTGTKGSTQSGTIAIPGYHTVELDEPQELVKDRNFSVVVKLKTPEVDSPVVVESYNYNENPNFKILSGRSFFSANGTAWVDAETLDGTSKGYPCLKAFTKTRPLYKGKDFTEFSIPGQISSVIDTTTHTVTVTMPHETKISALVADFKLSDKASAKVESVPQVSVATPNNFSSPVTYTVTAENGDVQNWDVTVILAAAPPVTPTEPETPEVKPSDVSPLVTKEDSVSSNSGAKPMSDQDTTDLINDNDDLLKFFAEDKITEIIAVELNGSIKDIKIPVKTEYARNVEDVVMEYDGSQTITPVIAQIKSNGSSDSMSKFDISLPSEQINSLMSSASEETLTFRFRVTTKESVIMFDGRDLVAEQLASIETKGELYYIVIAFSNNPEVGLTFNDLSGSVFKVGTLESGGDVSQGGGCSLGNFALAAILLILPLMFTGKKQNRSC